MTSKADQLLVDTVLQMHASVVTLSNQVGELNGKVGTFIAQMASQDDRTTTLEVRTNKLENRQHWYSGIGTALGLLFGAGGAHFLKN